MYEKGKKACMIGLSPSVVSKIQDKAVEEHRSFSGMVTVLVLRAMGEY